MSDVPVVPDSIGRRADLPSLAFECSWTDGGVGGAWVHVAGELDIAGFKTGRTLRALLAMLGSMAVEGPVIEWVATHRKHHRFSDHRGDPHSPHLDHAPGWRGALGGLGHAHVGWMFRGQDTANPARDAKDLLVDRDLVFISRLFAFWVLLGPSRLVSAWH